MFRHLTSSRFAVIYHPISPKSHIRMASRSSAPGILREISRGDLSLGAANSIVCKTGFKALGSYNWLDKPEPTILVPGSPPKWTPRPTETQLTPDAGHVLIDQNAHRCPDHPLEPLFRALLTNNPAIDLTTIDLVTDRNNLRKLLRFVSNQDDKPFTIRVQRLGTTTLFTRTEPKSSEHITGFRGFGHEFEKAYTSWPRGMENSTGHNRIVQYNLCGLKLVVRFEVDASTHVGTVVDADTLSSLLGGVSLAPVCDSTTFHVTRRGTLVPQESVLEIKTRAVSRTLDLADVLPQLWFSETPALAVGYHSRGRFGSVKPEKMDLEGWERNNAPMLRKLVEMLRVIVKEAEKAEGRRCVVQGMGDGTLRIVKGSAVDCLPGDIKAKFQ
ncbi:hypothetical protein Q9L58_010133 [Maublancomyces gigas]|uniref:Geranylgeranyl pyrophosphate synthetase n=1 Tax=Discina gigas TaxID=1032678 RepID=A0ABR3G5E0_9PEZI